MLKGRKCVSPGFGFYFSRVIFAILKAVTCEDYCAEGYVVVYLRR
jgi:hypothetical protein